MGSVFNAASSKDTFKAGVNMAFALFLVVLLLLGTLTYATFGSSLKPVVLTNIGREIDGGASAVVPQWFAQAINALLSVRCVQVLPVFQQPIIASCYNFLGRHGIDLTTSEELESELSLLKFAPRVF